MSEQNNQNTQESQTPHKRRVRYKGKYPKKFEEKYKELHRRQRVIFGGTYGADTIAVK